MKHPRFDWRPIESIAGVDPEIPVLTLRDSRDVDRVHFMLVSDQERHTLEWLVENAEVKRSMLVVREKRERWFDTWTGRLVALGTIAIGVLAVLAYVHTLTH